MSGPSSHLLTAVVRDAAAGTATPADLHRAFLAATVYCERGAEPGFQAWGGAEAGLIPVYTSPEQLALARGTVPWFALTGADLLDQLPAGYDLLLDPGGEAPLRLRPAALTRRVTVDIAREPATP
jgi:putative intracellular protease/amidase